MCACGHTRDGSLYVHFPPPKTHLRERRRGERGILGSVSTHGGEGRNSETKGYLYIHSIHVETITFIETGKNKDKDFTTSVNTFLDESLLPKVNIEESIVGSRS